MQAFLEKKWKFNDFVTPAKRGTCNIELISCFLKSHLTLISFFKRGETTSIFGNVWPT